MTQNLINDSRWIVLEGAFNVRDAGGYSLADGAVTRSKALLRADSLHKLTPPDQEILMSYGLRSIVDLRHESEFTVSPNVFAQSDKVGYHSIPIFEVQPDASNGSADLAVIYRHMIDKCQTGLLKALQTIANAPEGAVLVHCTAGKDRTGVVMALTLEAIGVPRETIIEDYTLTTQAMKKLRPQRLGNADIKHEMVAYIEKMLGSEPELMADLHDYIDEQYGGTNAYLAQIGFSSSDHDRLYERLVQTQ